MHFKPSIAALAVAIGLIIASPVMDHDLAISDHILERQVPLPDPIIPANYSLKINETEIWMDGRFLCPGTPLEDVQLANGTVTTTTLGEYYWNLESTDDDTRINMTWGNYQSTLDLLPDFGICGSNEPGRSLLQDDPRSPLGAFVVRIAFYLVGLAGGFLIGFIPNIAYDPSTPSTAGFSGLVTGLALMLSFIGADFYNQYVRSDRVSLAPAVDPTAEVTQRRLSAVWAAVHAIFTRVARDMLRRLFPGLNLNPNRNDEHRSVPLSSGTAPQIAAPEQGAPAPQECETTPQGNQICSNTGGATQGQPQNAQIICPRNRQQAAELVNLAARLDRLEAGLAQEPRVASMFTRDMAGSCGGF